MRNYFSLKLTEIDKTPYKLGDNFSWWTKDAEVGKELTSDLECPCDCRVNRSDVTRCHEVTPRSHVLDAVVGRRQTTFVLLERLPAR